MTPARHGGRRANAHAPLAVFADFWELQMVNSLKSEVYIPLKHKLDRTLQRRVMEKYSDVLRRLADMLDDDFHKNVHQVCRELSKMVLSMLGVAV